MSQQVKCSCKHEFQDREYGNWLRACTPNYLCKQHKMHDMKQCEQAAQTFKATTQNSATQEKESRVFLYCAPEGNWHDPKNGRGK